MFRLRRRRVYLAYGSSCSTRPTSVLSTSEEPPERAWRLTLRSLWPRLWRRFAAYRLKPFAVLRKRLAAARLVFNLGIDITPYVVATDRRVHFCTRYGRTPRGTLLSLWGVTSSSVQKP